MRWGWVGCQKHTHYKCENLSLFLCLQKLHWKKLFQFSKTKENSTEMSFQVKLLSLNIIDAISLETNKTKMDPHMCVVESAAIFFYSPKWSFSIIELLGGDNRRGGWKKKKKGGGVGGGGGGGGGREQGQRTNKLWYVKASHFVLYQFQRIQSKLC